jgi:hypothetical protein
MKGHAAFSFLFFFFFFAVILLHGAGFFFMSCTLRPLFLSTTVLYWSFQNQTQITCTKKYVQFELNAA